MWDARLHDRLECISQGMELRQMNSLMAYQRSIALPPNEHTCIMLPVMYPVIAFNRCFLPYSAPSPARKTRSFGCPKSPSDADPLIHAGSTDVCMCKAIQTLSCHYSSIGLTIQGTLAGSHRLRQALYDSDHLVHVRGREVRNRKVNEGWHRYSLL